MDFLGDAASAQGYAEEYERLKRCVNQHAWDGAWYVSYIDKDGQPVGSKKNREGQILPLHPGVGRHLWLRLARARRPGHAGRAGEARHETRHQAHDPWLQTNAARHQRVDLHARPQGERRDLPASQPVGLRTVAAGCGRRMDGVRERAWNDARPEACRHRGYCECGRHLRPRAAPARCAPARPAGRPAVARQRLNALHAVSTSAATTIARIFAPAPRSWPRSSGQPPTTKRGSRKRPPTASTRARLGRPRTCRPLGSVISSCATTVSTGASAAGTTRDSGSSNQKVLPSPTWLRTQIVPPINSTSRREMASPRPVPAEAPRGRSHRPVRRARRCAASLSGAMPMPVSRTVKRSSTPSSGGRPDRDAARRRASPRRGR